MNNDPSTITVDGQPIIIYNNRKPDAYQESDIFDPDNPESGKYFPSLYSLVIRKDSTLWYVSARDDTTFKTTLSPCSIVEESSDKDKVKLVNYGNDHFCIYQDARVSPTKLIVDAKVLFYGLNLKEYTLSRKTDTSAEEIISLYLDNMDHFVSDRIPMTPVGEKLLAYKFPTNCHTNVRLIEGEPITLTAYDTFGDVVAKLTLFVRNAVWLNDLNSLSNPIVEFNADCLQERGDEWYIKERQDPAHLNIRPYIVFADGTKKYVNVDNMRCFIYGLDDFLPSYPGYSQTVVLKYFLGRNEVSQTGDRFLTMSKKLVVVKDSPDYSGKISTIPVYSPKLGSWYLRFFLYTDKRNTCIDVTDAVEYDAETSFNGKPAMYGTEQKITLSLDLNKVIDIGMSVIISQNVYVTVWDHRNYERYTLRDNKTTDVVYGVDGSITRRPVIGYDKQIKKYFIPTSIFRNKEAVIESFYVKSSPFFDTRTETVAPTPTHFILRDAVSGRQLNANPIELDVFGSSFNVTGPDNYLDQTVVVEFLQQIADEYRILYGAPVDVHENAFNDQRN